MKAKIIPFDLETAKKIQAGEIEGKIICNSSEAEILDFDLFFKGQAYICAKTKGNSGEYTTRLFDSYGRDAESKLYYSLTLEVHDNKPQFKPFNKVLVRENDASLWRAGFYSHELDGKHCVCGNYYPQCIPYEGNEHLLGTTDKPKEE